MQPDPYATGVLDKVYHERLVADRDKFTRDAGIQPHWLWTSMVDTCSPDEIDYFKKFRFHQAKGTTHGLCYTRITPNGDPEEHMQAMAGAFLRNFIRARVMTLSTVLTLLDEGDAPDATVLLIPNFFLSKAEGGGLPVWKVALLYDMLVKRANHGKQTVIYATSLADLGKEYGAAFRRIVEKRFLQVEI